MSQSRTVKLFFTTSTSMTYLPTIFTTSMDRVILVETFSCSPATRPVLYLATKPVESAHLLCLPKRYSTQEVEKRMSVREVGNVSNFVKDNPFLR